MLEIEVPMEKISLEQKLKMEERMCPKCKYVLTNPFSERCPRCLTFVPVNDPGCGSCIHNSSCAHSSLQTGNGKR